MKYSFGASNGFGFSGFISYICLKNSLLCGYKSITLSTCSINQYLNGSKCENCSKECSSILGCRRLSCNLCYSNDYQIAQVTW